MENKLLLTKVFTEVRLSPSLLYSDLTKRNIIANEYREKFYNLQFDDSGKIEAVDVDKKTKVTFFNNRIVVDTDEFNNYEHLKLTAESAIDRYSKVFEVSVFNRIGIRFNYGLTVNSIDDAMAIIGIHFFSILNKNVLVNLGKSESHQVFMSFNDNGQKYNVGIYPATLTTVEGNRLESKQQTYYLLTFDVDYFKEGKIKLDECLNSLSKSNNFVLTKIKSLLNLMDVKIDEN